MVKVSYVAVVQIQANNLPTLSWGDSQQIKPGSGAIAIGNPLGLDNQSLTRDDQLQQAVNTLIGSNLQLPYSQVN